MSASGQDVLADSLVHLALLYRSDAEYLNGVAAFVEEGLAAGEPVLLAAPAANLDALRDHLGDAPASVQFLDLTAAGPNPARYIPAYRRFVDSHPGRRTRFMGEPIWPGRTPGQVREATRHEALCNLAFADAPTTILCPYDAAALPDAVLADARRTHTHLAQPAGRVPCPDYDTAGMLIGEHPRPEQHPQSEHLATATELADLSVIRRLIEARAEQAGLGPRRVEELQIAVGEVATNGLVHGGGRARICTWLDEEEGSLVVEVSSDARIEDPFTGRHLPGPGAGGRRGVWIVNHLCDLVELHSGPWGATVRLHMQRNWGPALPNVSPSAN